MNDGLKRLLTDLGERSSYDAVSQCSRCGYCEQVCPTYVATGRESFSPRGRNQLVRLMLEGRLEDPASAEEALSTCLLCGACQTVCPAHVPTPDIVLEGRRALKRPAARFVDAVQRLMRERPALFRTLMAWGFRMKRWGLGTLAARSGVLKLLGFGALGEMALHVDDAPERTLDEVLAGRPELGPAAEAAWAYFAPCGPRWLMPRVGEATVEVLGALHGRGAALDNTCCGLLSFNYGSLGEARASARAVIERAEARGLAASAPVVGDCSSCVSFLKSYPQLFLEEPAWKARAEAFAARVKDAVEMLPAGGVPEDARVKDLAVHDACRLRNGQNCADAPRPALKAVAGGTLKALAKPEHCCGGAGAFAFVHPELSEELLKAKVADIADSQARVVAAASTSCLVQLERGLRKYYSACRVAHPTELVAEALRRRKSGGAPRHDG